MDVALRATVALAVVLSAMAVMEVMASVLEALDATAIPLAMDMDTLLTALVTGELVP